MRKITACLVIHNEEKVLERCLQSIEKIASSILIVHDGPCHDDSLQIAQKLGAKIFVRSFIGEAEPHRAWLMKKVRTEYCLQIDADEYVSDEFVSNIDELIARSADGYTCIWPYWNTREYRTHGWPRKLCLFKISSARYIAVPHEAVRIEGRVEHTAYVLHHKPMYDNLSWDTFRTKWIQWARIHATYYHKSPMQIERLHDQNFKLIPHYSNWMKKAPFTALPLGLYHAVGTYLSGGWKEGFIGARSSMAMGMYYAMVCYFVWARKST